MMSARRGGEGGTPKADAVRKLSKGGCVKMQTRGEGVKKSENFADVICTWPLIMLRHATANALACLSSPCHNLSRFHNLLLICQTSQRIGCVILHCNLQCGITQPILRLFFTYLYLHGSTGSQSAQTWADRCKPRGAAPASPPSRH